MNILRCLVAATVCLLHCTWSAAAPHSGVLDLFDRLPDPPATAEEAARWMDKDGKLVHAPLIALKAEVEAHRKAVAAPMQAQAPAQQVQAKVQVDDLSKGMANVGIDMARMQGDPAYAKEVQARMKSMSPEQLMAMSKAMSQPMGQNPNRKNEALAMDQDSPAVKAAAQAGFEYGNQQVARIQAHAARWQDAEAEVNAKVFKLLKAAAYGESAVSSTHQLRIVGYDEAMLGELGLLIAKTEEIVLRASRTLHCGSQAVTVPQAVCR